MPYFKQENLVLSWAVGKRGLMERSHYITRYSCDQHGHHSSTRWLTYAGISTQWATSMYSIWRARTPLFAWPVHSWASIKMSIGRGSQWWGGQQLLEIGQGVWWHSGGVARREDIIWRDPQEPRKYVWISTVTISGQRGVGACKMVEKEHKSNSNRQIPEDERGTLYLTPISRQMLRRGAVLHYHDIHVRHDRLKKMYGNPRERWISKVLMSFNDLKGSSPTRGAVSSYVTLEKLTPRPYSTLIH